MELAQGLSANLKVGMEQTLAPQLLKSLSILAMPVMELETQINQELDENPVLEVEDPSETQDSEKENDLSVEDCDSFMPAASDAPSFDENRDDFTESIEKYLDSENLDPRDSSGSTSQDDNEKSSFMFDSIASERSLQSDLMEQLALSDCSNALRAAATEIIGSISHTGYLETALADIAQSTGVTLEDAEKALEIVQAFDPPGIGARDLGECLMLQLKRSGRGGTKTALLVKEHLDDLAKNRLPKIAAEMNMTLDELSDAIKELRMLDPHPGLALDGSDASYVEPDVTVTRDGSEYRVESSGNAVPRLTVSKRYLDMLSDPLVNDEAKKYIREKILSAKQLMHNLDQRKSTIQRIAELIVSAQYAFFEKGGSALRPMTMREIAEKIGVNETTVSRAVAGKYMATPRGLVKMRDFFTSGFATGDGDDVSNSSVKEMIRDMISKEDTLKPLSDSRIESLLAKRGLTVARRTVAKYREELGIGSSQMRKVYK